MLRRIGFYSALLAFIALSIGAVMARRYVRSLDAILVEKFSGRRWDFPSKIYADTTLLYPGENIDAVGLLDRLARLQYRQVEQPSHPGEYDRDLKAGSLDLYLRSFDYPSGRHPARLVHLDVDGATIRRIVDVGRGEDETSVRLEPELLAGLYQNVWEERHVVSLNQLPSTLINAVITTEDQHFFQHHGIDFGGVLRALWVDLTHGRVVQGGSTLTQQLMKNFFLSEERTMSRKIREAVMAVLAERRYSKREILENYLNEIYLGQNGSQGIFGVWQAAHFYFHKDPSALTLSECALIAGLIKAPNRYTPFQHPVRAKERRDYILRLMAARGLISRGEMQEAMAEPLGAVPSPPRHTDAPYFVDFLRHELAQTYPQEVLTRDGLSIFTGLDTEIQRDAEEALKNGLAELERRYPRLTKGKQKLQACLIAIQPQTGEIKAMMGGRDYASTQFNRVVQALRQPGSVFKPFTYVAALDHPPGVGDILPTTRIDDEPFTWEYDGRSWSPANYEHEYRGSVTVREALEDSLNAATARLAQRVGLARIRDVAQRMGITTPLPLVPSMVLGAVEVTPFEIAQAYGVLANQGLRATPLAVRSVIDHDGNLIERNPMEIEQAIPPEVAFLVTHLLQGVIDEGTGAGARRRGFTRPAAGKTGTTNDYRDAWFAGFTPHLLAVVWVGFDQPRPLNLAGSQAALPIWTDFMKRATAGEPVQDFIPPPGVVLVKIDPMTGGLATPACPHTIEEAFLAGDEPTTPCPLHATRGVMPTTLRQPLRP